MSELKVTVIQPDKIKIDGEYDHIIVPGIEGDIGISSDHTPLITQIRSGILFLFLDNEKLKYAIHDGFVSIENNEVKIICDTIEAEEEIDLERAQNSKKRAEKRLKSNDEDIDFRRAEASLKRALARINSKKKSEI